jgi:hypothetical protein
MVEELGDCLFRDRGAVTAVLPGSAAVRGIGAPRNGG